jgi:hypothetical protein
MAGHKPMPPAGDWSALAVRFNAEIIVLGSWAIYKAASNKIILSGEVMQIVTWGLIWTVRRAEVARVALLQASLTIFLTDGSKIRPSTFWASGPGILYLRLGWFQNFCSRQDIRDRIMQWRQEPAALSSINTAPSARRWRVRPNATLLATLLLGIAVEAVILTVAI